MLDTKARHLVEPFLRKSAVFFTNRGWRPVRITKAALGAGLLSALTLLAGFRFWALLFLWVSGWLDAVDGTAARMTGKTSGWGTLLDVTFDRIVEVALVLALARRHPEQTWGFLLLLSAVLLSMTVFLTSAALVENKGEKSFHYQSGIAERTEGFLFFSLMILFPDWLGIITTTFAAVVSATFIQRLLEIRGMNRGKE